LPGHVEPAARQRAETRLGDLAKPLLPTKPYDREARQNMPEIQAVTIPQAFKLAVQRHQAGQLADAESLYRQILAAQPNHFDALHLLGVIAHQVGRDDLAVEWTRRAIALNPTNPFAHFNLGEACRAAGRLEDAIAAYRRALQLQADFPHAHNNLGIALRERGRLDEAIAAYRCALQLHPDFPEIHNNLGDALREGGQFDEAIASCRRALQLKSDFPEALNNLGAALAGLGQIEEAIDTYQRALRLKPDYPEAHHNLGSALMERGQLGEAAAAYQKALALKPSYPEAFNHLGNALAGQGRREEAVAAYQRALELKPRYPEALNHLGVALHDLGRLEEAIAVIHRALELRPDYPEACNNLGNALRERGQMDQAIAGYRRALELKPDSPEALTNLGAALAGQGQLDDAIGAFRQALRTKPGHAAAHSNLVYALHFHPGHDARSISEERQRWNQRFGDPLKPFVPPRPTDCRPDRQLRVGYVSADFRDHPVGRQLLPLVARHDCARFEILCYSEAARPDWITERFRTLAGKWRNTIGISDARLAELVREDEVDILVDLAQHTAGNRLAMFARQPAPVQVSFAGYPGSTGLEAIKHRISDRFLETGGANEDASSKEHVHLIDSFWCFDPCGLEVDVNPLPALKNHAVTFGSLGKTDKVNDPALKLWARALATAKDSRLVMWSPAGSHRERTLKTLRKEGVEASRVEFVEFRPRREYLQLYHRLDIVLDTFPYNGHNTSLDALWMGVPVVSLAGNTPVSRAGLSQLTNLGLPELVARSESEYIGVAESLARDLPRLAQLRSALRARMEASVLMDAPRFAQSVEAAYRSMWERWCSGQSLMRSAAAS